MQLKELRKIARDATREALASLCGEHSIPKSLRERMVLGESDVGNGTLVFELYIPKRRPTDAVFITRAIVDKESGDVKVTVFHENLRAAGLDVEDEQGRGIDF